MVMEAMVCGRAIVTTDFGDVPFLVEDGKTGFIVKREDDGMLLERLATLIENRDVCVRMGQAGRTRVGKEFELCNFVDQTFQAYRAAGWKD